MDSLEDLIHMTWRNLSGLGESNKEEGEIKLRRGGLEALMWPFELLHALEIA